MGRNHRLPRNHSSLAFIVLALLFIPSLVFGQANFDQCIERLQGLAENEGIQPLTTKTVLATVRERPRVISSDRSQPEFVQTFAEYLQGHVTPTRVARGRQLLDQHAHLLARVEAKYGVPPQYIVAFWGMETDYGRVLGNVPVFDSLATLACDDRRSDYFSSEFVRALKIIERNQIPQDVMVGSWAGAMGQTQFMPSAYLADGADGDGDGVVDLWRSLPDAFASAANFLRQLGWKSGWRWGREVVLPKGFDYFHSGLERSVSLSTWRREGVRKIDGTLIDDVEEPASLLIPAGHEGPAFLVYPNFKVIMRWNRSESFALSVGRLADRIAGGGPLHRPPPAGHGVAPGDIVAVQRKLNALGFDSGEADGIAGARTRQAVREWQRSVDVTADGHIDNELLRRLGI